VRRDITHSILRGHKSSKTLCASGGLRRYVAEEGLHIFLLLKIEVPVRPKETYPSTMSCLACNEACLSTSEPPSCVAICGSNVSYSFAPSSTHAQIASAFTITCGSSPLSAKQEMRIFEWNEEPGEAPNPLSSMFCSPFCYRDWYAHKYSTLSTALRLLRPDGIFVGDIYIQPHLSGDARIAIITKNYICDYDEGKPVECLIAHFDARNAGKDECDVCIRYASGAFYTEGDPIAPGACVCPMCDRLTIPFTVTIEQRHSYFILTPSELKIDTTMKSSGPVEKIISAWALLNQ